MAFQTYQPPPPPLTTPPAQVSLLSGSRSISRSRSELEVAALVEFTRWVAAEARTHVCCCLCVCLFVAANVCWSCFLLGFSQRIFPTGFLSLVFSLGGEGRTLLNIDVFVGPSSIFLCMCFGCVLCRTRVICVYCVVYELFVCCVV